MHQKIRIGFLGTPFLASRVLADLIADPHFEVVFVVTNPDKPIGRSGELQPTPVKKLALEHHITVYTPTKIRDNIDFFGQLSNHNCDYFIVVAYGRILPKEILDMPKKMCINVHGSILPKYRGASPIQAALLHGEKETGVTIMKMSEGMDEGDILKIREIPINPLETSETLFEKFAQVSGPTLIMALDELEHGGITSLPQDHSQATYCTKIEKEDGLIDWSKSSEEIYHMWQAYTPWPGIFAVYEGKRLILEQVKSEEGRVKNTEKILSFRHREEGSDLASGNQGQDCFVPRSDKKEGQVTKLEDGTIGIICREGILTLEQVKLEGKKSQNIKDFVNGNQNFIGCSF